MLLKSLQDFNKPKGAYCSFQIEDLSFKIEDLLLKIFDFKKQYVPF